MDACVAQGFVNSTRSCRCGYLAGHQAVLKLTYSLDTCVGPELAAVVGELHVKKKGLQARPERVTVWVYAEGDNVLGSVDWSQTKWFPESNGGWQQVPRGVGSPDSEKGRVDGVDLAARNRRRLVWLPRWNSLLPLWMRCLFWKHVVDCR